MHSCAALAGSPLAAWYGAKSPWGRRRSSVRSRTCSGSEAPTATAIARPVRALSPSATRMSMRNGQEASGTPLDDHCRAVTKNFGDPVHHLGGVVANPDDRVCAKLLGVPEHQLER